MDRFLRRIIRDRETECDGYIPNRVEEVAARRGVSMGLSRYRIELQGRDRPGLRVQLGEDDIKYLEEPHKPEVTTGYYMWSKVN